VGVDNYHDWIQLVAEFTVNSLNSWHWASGSVYYLLGLWSRLVSSMPYLKGDSPSLLDTYVPRITESYITSRWGWQADRQADGQIAESSAGNSHPRRTEWSLMRRKDRCCFDSSGRAMKGVCMTDPQTHRP
jgi:hypothetical protein